MKTVRTAAALTLVNVVILLGTLARGFTPFTAVADAAQSQVSASSTDGVAPVLRARTLELVDERGRVRARLNVESDGEVVFRLLDQQGTIRVKIGASGTGSALLLLDEATEPGVHMIARRRGSADRPATTSVTLRGEGGRERVLSP